jgi:uncharacterized protein
VGLYPARTCLSNNLDRYHHRIIRDLLWSLCSPSLIAETPESEEWLGDDWFDEIILELLEPLAVLDNDPSAVLTELEQGRDKRLGHIFETLLAHAFRLSQRYQLLARNILIKDGSRTLGELDMLVRDLRENRTIHLEVAVKFYLAINTGEETFEWLGPNPEDRLSDKKQGMEKQLRRSHSSEARRWLQEHDITIDERHATMKGRLFHPPGSPSQTEPSWINPNHLRGWWTDTKGFQRYCTGNDLVWVAVDKYDWLSPLTPNDTRQSPPSPDPATMLSRNSLSDRATSHPVCIAGLRDGYEIERGFIVPDYWPHPIKKIKYHKNIYL